MENFVKQLEQVGRDAQAFIENAIPVGSAIILWSEELEEQTGEGTADMPDFIHTPSGDRANIVKVEHVKDDACLVVYGITCEWGTGVTALLFDLSDEEKAYLAEYIRSELQLVK